MVIVPALRKPFGILPTVITRANGQLASAARFRSAAAVAGPLDDPNPTEKRWSPVWEDAIKSVRYGVGIAINNQENVYAEPKRDQAEYPAGNRDRTKDGT